MWLYKFDQKLFITKRSLPYINSTRIDRGLVSNQVTILSLSLLRVQYHACFWLCPL